MQRPVRARSLATRRAVVALLVPLLATACVADDAPGRVTEKVLPGDTEVPEGSVPSEVEEELFVLHAYTIGTELEGLRATLASFRAQHPEVRVIEEGAVDLAARVQDLVAAGSPPDVIILSAVGSLGDLVDDGVARPLDGSLDRSRLASDVVPGVLDPVTFGGSLYAVPIRLIPKSLVWYSPATFAEKDYSIPATWDELMALSDAMVADGLAPWCIGIESAEATGWVATDWVEDILLRAIGGDDYERWVAGDLAFGSSEVLGAVEQYMVPIWTNDAYVSGGRAGIASEAFVDSVGGILGDRPECGLHRQAMLVERLVSQREPAPEFGTDYDVFPLPPIDPLRRPLLGTGDYAAIVTDGPAASQLIAYLATAESGEPWAAQGGFLSPFVGFDTTNLLDGPAARLAGILADATSFHLDGSDRMPSAVGASPLAGSFWSEMTAWARAERTLGEAFANIDALRAQ